MGTIKFVDQNIWNDDTQQWEQIFQSTSAVIVGTTDGGNVQDKLDTLEAEISSAKNSSIAEIQAGVVEEGNTLAKLYSLITALQELVGSDDIDLDTVQEIVYHIKENRSDLTLISTNKINYSDIENSLLTIDTVENKVLDARQGRILKEFIDVLTNNISNLQTENEEFITENEFNLGLNSLYKIVLPTISDLPPDNPIDKQSWFKPLKTITV